MRSTMKPPESRQVGLIAIALGLTVVLAASLFRPTNPELAVQTPPSPAAPAVSAAAPAPPPTPPVPSAQGLRLHGLLGLGAIFAFPDGRQRFVAVGRDVVPGLRVARIEQQGVILASATGELRLGFEGAGAAPGATLPAAAAADSTTEQAQRDETLRYRLGLAPRRAGGRTAGFVVRPGVEMPALARAGLRPGDVILAVNGSGFDEERMLELAWQVANTPRTEFDVERNGRRMKLTLEPAR